MDNKFINMTELILFKIFNNFNREDFDAKGIA